MKRLKLKDMKVITINGKQFAVKKREAGVNDCDFCSCQFSDLCLAKQGINNCYETIGNGYYLDELVNIPNDNDLHKIVDIYDDWQPETNQHYLDYIKEHWNDEQYQ